MIRDTLANAVAHHQAGRLEQASRLYREILRIAPNQPDALHLLGLVAHQQGQHRRAVEWISRAVALNPNAPAFYSNLGAVYRVLGELDKAVGNCQRAVRIDPAHAQAHNNLGNALADQERLDEAVASFRRALEIQPSNPEALNNLGNALRRQGKLDQAEDCYRRALELEPRFAKALNNLGNILRSRGKPDEAEVHYRRALEINPRSSTALNNLGIALESQGKLDEAETCYRRALEIAPDYVDGLNNLGNMLINRGELDEAEACYRRALKVNPNLVHCHNGLGGVFQRRKMSHEAISHYRRALEIQPDYVDALANLAGLLEKLNRLEEAAQSAAQCLRLAPDHPLANLVAAGCDHRQGRFREGIERLEKLQPLVPSYSNIAKDIQFQLGRLHDRAGNTRKAFACFTEANRLAMQEFGQEVAERKQRYLQIIASFGEVFTRDWVDSWTPTPPFEEAETPVFLVGFPRSGTTLLDVILDSHPRIQTLAEKPTVYAIEHEARRLPGEYPRVVADLAPSTIESLRDAYFRAVDGFLARQPGTVLVDKHPLNMAAVGLILRFFADAKFIVAIRHPCDVCLSCFMQNFKLNNAMANFFTLEDAATLYDKVIRLWRRYVALLPHAYHLVKYEDLVDDFEGETQRLLRFLDVDWDDSVRHYEDHARQKDWIHTPSYRQVVEPIYKRAVGRWRRYTEYLEPVMDLLRPCAAFVPVRCDPHHRHLCRAPTTWASGPPAMGRTPKPFPAYRTIPDLTP